MATALTNSRQTLGRPAFPAYIAPDMNGQKWTALGGVPNRQIRRPRRAADSGLELVNPDRVCEATPSVINTRRAPT